MKLSSYLISCIVSFRGPRLVTPQTLDITSYKGNQAMKQIIYQNSCDIAISYQKHLVGLISKGVIAYS